MSEGRRICIVGFSELNRAWAQDQPRSVELWGINEAHNCTFKGVRVDDIGREVAATCSCRNPHRCICGSHAHIFLPRFDRWYQIHPANWKEEKRRAALKASGLRIFERDLRCFGRNEQHVKFLAECDKPLYMGQRDDRFPQALLFPWKELEKEFGIRHGRRKHLYSTSTVSYLLLHALYEHVHGARIREIRLAGIELALGTEYFWQKPSAEFYLGMAMGMGIKVRVPPTGSSILAAPRYILDTDSPIPVDYRADPLPLYKPTEEQLTQFATARTVEEAANGG